MCQVLRLRARIRFELLLDPANEREPELHVWLSQTVSPRVHVMRFPDSSGDWNATFEFDLCQAPFDHLHPAGAPQYAHRDSHRDRLWASCLNVDVFAHRRNMHGEVCLNQAGSLRIPLGELARALASEAPGREQCYAVDVPSYGGLSGHFTPSARNDKGRLYLSLLADRGGRYHPFLELQGGERIEQAPRPELIEMVRRVEEWKELAFGRYIAANVDLFQKLRPRWKATADINIYLSASPFARARRVADVPAGTRAAPSAACPPPPTSWPRWAARTPPSLSTPSSW